MSDDKDKERIAILGGGWGAISTALYLTDPANPDRDKYDITLYQLGWRLGGKGASGRGAYDRIEEHGLHIWMGFYDNSFRAIQQVFEEVQPIYRRLNGDANPFKSWRDAFKPHSYVVVGDHYEQSWGTWPVDFPTNDDVPGQTEQLWLSPWDYVLMALEWLVTTHRNAPSAQRRSSDAEHDGVFAAVGDFLQGRALDISNAPQHVLEAIWQRVREHDGPSESLLAAIVEALNSFLAAFAREARALVADDSQLRHLMTGIELVAVGIKGMIADGIVDGDKTLDALDGEDFRAWLHRHGASAHALHSSPVRAVYALVFAFENGEVNKPNLAAGVAIRALTRIMFAYRGAIFWKMQAGMGDVCFAPPYLVLRERGVKFRFFNRVEGLHADTEGRRVESIDIGIQASLAEGVDDYWPLENVQGLPCWPAEPNYDQLAQGDELKRRGIDLESYYTTWTPVARESLQGGRDFDQVVVAMPPPALEPIAGGLMAANQRFKAMVENLHSVRTQAVQFWFDDDLKGLGWTAPSPVMSGYVQPLNTYADMSQLIDKEGHPPGSVGSIAYFCGTMTGGVPAASQHETPDLAHARVRENALTFLQSLSGFLWPDSSRASGQGYSLNPQGTDFAHLVAPTAECDMARFDHQFFRANISPSQRYVQSFAGFVQYRLNADESGFDNVVLAGDWTRNGLNVGCIEATTMSGMLASHALTGFPEKADIIGLEVPTSQRYPISTR